MSFIRLNNIKFNLPEPEQVTLESLTLKYQGLPTTRQVIATFRADKALLSDDDREALEKLFGIE